MNQFKEEEADGIRAMETATLLIVSIVYLLHPSVASPSTDVRGVPQLSQKDSTPLLVLPSTPESTISPSSSSLRPPNIRSPLPYMIELYNQYQAGDVRKYRKRSNIIRSILPSRGKLDKDDILVFNLTAVRPSERLQRVELHIHRYHLTNGRKRGSTEIRISLFDMSTPASSLLTTVTVPKHGPGLQTIDVTGGFVDRLGTSSGVPLILGFRIDEMDGKGGHKTIPKSHFRKLASQSFITVFSKERISGRTGEVRKHALDIVKARQRNASVLHSEVSTKRKRSVVNNELPDYLPHINDVIANASLESLRTWVAQGKIDASIIPHPEVLKPRKPFGQQRKQRKKRRRKNRKLPEIWQQQARRKENDVTFKEESDDDNKGLCRRQKLVVDVADIGWNEWIISPQTFDVHFCAGVCRFPLTKRDQPSNHATLQSMVHAFGLYPNVPAPCCVPQSLSSVTLLFFDEDYNVVLKNYPNMKVESCACR